MGAFVLLTYLGTRALGKLPPPVSDTREFHDARVGFSGLLHASGLTPREVKRFINRVRYLAMKQRVLADPLTHVPDDVLVALAAIERTRPDWLARASFREDAVKFLNDAVNGVPESVRAFVENWPAAAAIPAHIPAYRELAQMQDLGD
jgi:hypothetical protein